MKKYRLTFDTIAQAHEAYCKGHHVGCDNCPILSEAIKTDLSCGEFVERYPDMAIKLMDLEVIDVPPVLTAREWALCKALGARYVSRDDHPFDPDRVELWTDKPGRPGKVWQYNGSARGVASVDARILPSVGPGELVDIENCTVAK